MTKTATLQGGNLGKLNYIPILVNILPEHTYTFLKNEL